MIRVKEELHVLVQSIIVVLVEDGGPPLTGTY